MALFPDNEKKILDLINRGDMASLVMLFRTNRKTVFSFVTRNSGTPDDAEDILQEALIILWERIRAGRFELSAGLQTFVYGTAKNLWLRQLARKRREVPDNWGSHEPLDDDPSSFDRLVDQEQSAMVERAMRKLREPCRSLLIAFYWERLSMDEIAVKFGFANAQTAKSKKYQCKKALKELLS